LVSHATQHTTVSRSARWTLFLLLRVALIVGTYGVSPAAE
jgi:hypothetical protein